MADNTPIEWADATVNAINGCTGVAAVRAGRIFTGIEHNPKYFETAVRRITAAYQERAAA